jgi:cleavage and polyadenylation specificity factor subunit 1
MRHFKNIAGYEGVFMCGPYPHWVILTARGELRTHPMSIDWSVPCFAAFNNVNCPQGFIYINRKVQRFNFLIVFNIFFLLLLFLG